MAIHSVGERLGLHLAHDAMVPNVFGSRDVWSALAIFRTDASGACSEKLDWFDS